MKSIQYEGFNAVVTAMVNGSDGLLMISVAGQTVMARAIVAALVSLDLRKMSSGIQVGELDVHLERFANYRVLSQKGQRQEHGVTTVFTVLHHALTVGFVGDGFYLLQKLEDDPETPPAGFFRRLRLCSKMPLLPEWEDWLWKEGKESLLVGERSGKSISHAYMAGKIAITECTGFGVRCWKVLANRVLWSAILRRHFGLSVKMVPHGMGWREAADPENGWKLVRHEGGFRFVHGGKEMQADGKPYWCKDVLAAQAMLEAAFGVKVIGL